MPSDLNARLAKVCALEWPGWPEWDAQGERKRLRLLDRQVFCVEICSGETRLKWKSWEFAYLVSDYEAYALCEKHLRERLAELKPWPHHLSVLELRGRSWAMGLGVFVAAVEAAQKEGGR